MIIFDTETTGLPLPYASPLKDQPWIIEFAAVKFSDEPPHDEIGKLEFFIKPGVQLPEKITEITGLTDDDLKDAQPFPAHYPTLVNFFLGERYLIGHNVKFDTDLLRFDLMRMDKLTEFPWPPNHICTVVQSMDIRGYRLRQEQLYEHITGEAKKGAHRAMADVADLTTIVSWMIDEGRIKIA